MTVRMKNFDVLKQMPLKNYSSMVFNIVTHECKTEVDFEKFLDKEIPEHLEKEMKEALQEMQCSSSN